MKKISNLGIIFFLILNLFWTNNSQAFALNPLVNDSSFANENFQNDTSIKKIQNNEILSDLISHFTKPIHEEITRQAGASEFVDDVSWNDVMDFGVVSGPCKNKLLKFKENPICYFIFLEDGLNKSQEGWINPSGPRPPTFKQPPALLYRSHFGDMQFLHSMATTPNESIRETRAKILEWAEFAWKASLDLNLDKPAPIKILNGLSARQIFTGCYNPKVCDIKKQNADTDLIVRKKALGSLMHMVQDSFSRSHTCRALNECDSKFGLVKRVPTCETKEICQFYYYPYQNDKSHSSYDDPDVNSDEVKAAVDATSFIYAKHKENADWNEIRDYLINNVYPVSETNNATAGVGKSIGRKCNKPIPSISNCL